MSIHGRPGNHCALLSGVGPVGNKVGSQANGRSGRCGDFISDENHVFRSSRDGSFDGQVAPLEFCGSQGDSVVSQVIQVLFDELAEHGKVTGDNRFEEAPL